MRWSRVRETIIYCPYTGRQCGRYATYCDSIKRSNMGQEVWSRPFVISRPELDRLPDDLADKVRNDYCSENQIAAIGSYACDGGLELEERLSLMSTANFIHVARVHFQ